ncbi:hypothetical protein GGS20DRAFT_366687 [Poronia punctata]|nr:hypothetical protein GGS20DRAFT_366687 [Poronia punctata]
MASSPPMSDDLSASVIASTPSVGADTDYNDPFRSAGPAHHRYSHFNSQLFALDPDVSPAQAKRALEAHLAETDRRMEEAGKLGTALVQQRNELTERLKEVERFQAEGELSDDLRQKLIEIEKDYYEVAKETARAFLPKSRVPSNEVGASSPYVPEGKSGKRSVSPSKFEAQATGSPTKLGLPNRKVRNQPSNRIHDIEFATEISTSLIVQVRTLQGALHEREEELKEVKVENTKLEYEVQGYQQRLKNLDDNEHRYKDENWNLETQVHDLMAKEREAADREKKLTQTLNILQAEKNAAQRELDEIKLGHAKLVEEHAAVVKHHDIELGTAKRTMVMGESERAAMQRKIDDLTGQNQELAKAVSASVRGRKLERESILGMSDEDFQTAHDNTTPEHSPPPSPVKSTPRHSMLESETLKTSLAHAQRTIQSLRSNVHREKTERMETRRLLQEARDEIERMRNDPIVPTRRTRKAEAKELFKKPPRLLGGLRSARSEIFADDSTWEDQPDIVQHPRSSPISRETTIFAPVPEQMEQTDQFETANETSDAAFETANELATETDDFHTGAEEFSSDDVETETESPSRRRTLKGGRGQNMFSIQRSMSIDSTASTEDEDYHYEDSRTPTSLPPLHAKFPLRVARGANRRPSRHASEEPAMQGSPASFSASSLMGTPKQPVQSLAAELGDFDGSDNESNMSATPSRRSTRVRAVTPPPAVPMLPKVSMVDSGMMTEPLSELAISTMHAHYVEPLPEPDTAGPIIAALHAKHAEQLQNINAEKTVALDAMKSQHRDELAQAATALTLAHAQELEALRNNHGEAIAQSLAEMEASHARAMESLQSKHTDELGSEVKTAIASTQESYERELESLKSLHAEQLAQEKSQSKDALDAHLEALETLQASHAKELAQMESDLKAAALADIESLNSKHAEELSRLRSENEAAHASALAVLVATHTQQIETTKKDLSDTHAREVEGLKSSHAAQLEQTKESIIADYDGRLETLEAAHVEKAEKAKASIEAVHSEEIDSLRTTHAQQLTRVKEELASAHATTLAALSESHNKELEDAKSGLLAAHSQELESLRSSHEKQQEALGKEKDATHAAAVASLLESHKKQVSELKDNMSTAHSRELEAIKASHVKEQEELKKVLESANAVAIAAMVESHTKQLETTKAEGDVALSREIGAVKDAHAQEIETLNSQHAAAHAKELDGFKAALGKQVESSKAEGNAAHTQQIEAIKAAHAEILEAHKRDTEQAHSQAIEALKSAHEREIDTLKSEHAAARSKEVEVITAKHLDELKALRAENTAAKAEELKAQADKHLDELQRLKDEHESSKSLLIAELSANHAKETEALRHEFEAAHSTERESLSAKYTADLEAVKRESEADLTKHLEELANSHEQKLAEVREDSDRRKLAELAALGASHTANLEILKANHDAELSRKVEELAESRARELEELRQRTESDKSDELAALRDQHQRDLDKMSAELGQSHADKIAELKSAHDAALTSLRIEHESYLDKVLKDLNADHAKSLETAKAEGEDSQSAALEALRREHALQLEQLRKDSESTLAREVEAVKVQYVQILDQHAQESEAKLTRELEALRAQHAEALESYIQVGDAEKARLMARHAEELEALKLSLAADQPALEYSPMSSIQTEPVEFIDIKSARREAFVMPRDREPVTPRNLNSGFGRKSKATPATVIAEDDTRQSPNDVNRTERVGSEQPFREITTNTDTRPTRKPQTETANQGSQTTLTADGLDQLMKHQQHHDAAVIDTVHEDEAEMSFDEGSISTPATVRIRRPSTESFGSVVRTKPRTTETGGLEAITARRPGSSASYRSGVYSRPPLPTNHLEVIEAARTGSAQGHRSTMAPPAVPASAYRASPSRPQTPSIRRPLSPTPNKDATITPRVAKAMGYADVQSPTKMPMRSRQSSISSFASEIDTRFNINNGMGMDSGLSSHTDPRMIQAVTQTMIGEYLWKYTRKAGRGEMSENRHRRFFWVHPYTRALYWSDGDPAAANRGEMRAKSVPIEAVRVVADDNPMPPGLHRKSLVVISPGRTIKFTCTTGQRHETWFNALSYLLLRSSNEDKQESEEASGNITQEDVDEFNPSMQPRPANGQRSRPPPSLSSYNSRTTRNDSPSIDMSIPTLTPTHERDVARSGTLGRLSGYWKSSSRGRSTFSSLRSRSHQPYDSAIYEASEVPDSAEDLRQIIEQQDRESDRLENVRACCDGKHDVSTLPRTTKRGRLSSLHTQSQSHGHTHTHTHPPPGPSSSQPVMGSVRSRV